MIAVYARVALKDPHAQRFGRKGQDQHGVDVWARQWTGSVQRSWAFQAKCTLVFQPQHLRDELALLDSFPAQVHDYVVVTTAPRSAGVQLLAAQLERERGHRVAVWYWEHFSVLFRETCGQEGWLSSSARQSRRAAWIADLRAVASDRAMLDPSPIPHGREVKIQDVWVQPQLASAFLATGSPSACNTGDWGRRQVEESTPLLPIVGEAGSGKSSLLWHAAGDLADRAAAATEAALPLVIGAGELLLHGAAALSCAMSTGQPGPLWGDPLTSWVVLVDSLDEVPRENDRVRVVREMRELAQRSDVIRIIVACRALHVRSYTFGNVPALRVLPWSTEEVGRFGAAWARASGRPPSRGLRGPAFAQEAALAVVFDVDAARPGGDWVTRERWLDFVLSTRPTERGSPVPFVRREDIESLALAAMKQEGALDSSARWDLPSQPSELDLEREAERTGLYRVDDGTIVFTHLRLTEALAAFALSRQPVEEIVRLSVEPRLAEVARLAALGAVVSGRVQFEALIIASEALR